MRQVVTIEALEVLDAIDRKGSFAAAAEELYRVPSAITYTVQKLEQDLGLTLFKREGRRSVLTPAGQELLTEGRRILEATTALVESTKRVARGWEPRVNIAVDTVLPLDAFFPLLNCFYELQPDIEFNLYEESLAGTWDALLGGRADLVVGAPGEAPGQKGVAFKQLGQLETVLAAAPSHPLAQAGQPVSREMLSRYRSVVVRDTSRSLRQLTVGLLKKQPVVTVPTMADKIEAQCQGLGVGYVPSYLTQDLFERGELVALEVAPDVEATHTPMPLVMAWKTNNKGRALQWLVREIPQLGIFSRI